MNKQMRDYRRNVGREDSDHDRVVKPEGKAEYKEIPRSAGTRPGTRFAANTLGTRSAGNTRTRSAGNTPGTNRGQDGRLKNGYPKNRACMVAPERHDVGQLTSRFKMPKEPKERYHKALYEQYGFDPVSDNSSPVKELKHVLCGISTHDYVEMASQYANPGPSVLPNFVPKPDDSPWQIINTIDEIEQFIEEPDDQNESTIRISDVPRVTVVAEKFTRLKKDNIELRKLDTRIVCVEYDIIDENTEKPIQKMRAFFSVKPARKEGDEQSTHTIPSDIKKRYKISETDIQKLSVKEIEFIDGKVAENKPYLDDLRKVLKRKQAGKREKKNKNSLDLFSMYHMAKRNKTHSDFYYSNTNLLSKAELDNVKQLILQHCDSTTNNGVGRRKIRHKNHNTDEVAAQSECIFLELLREQDKK